MIFSASRMMRLTSVALWSDSLGESKLWVGCSNPGLHLSVVERSDVVERLVIQTTSREVG